MLQSTLLFAPAGDLPISLVAGLLGLLIGSFLNVVIHRIPKMMQRESDNYVAARKRQGIAAYRALQPDGAPFGLPVTAGTRSRRSRTSRSSAGWRCAASAAIARRRSRRAIRPSNC
jgi:prepilin signal peptidase PulO-like enzyme (type II secretory pathway)